MAFLGIDTGGTFTDFLLLDDAGGLRVHKVLSTPHAPEKAILQGIGDLGLDTRGLGIVHGTTVATNAILEGKGVKTAYITNRGFADVLAIGRQARRALYDLTPAKRPPLLPPGQCLEVDTRLSAQGEALASIDEGGLQALLEALRQLEPRAVAINLLFSFLDDGEERRIERAIAGQFGDRVFISRSSDVLPEYREYERGMTTTLNAMVGPLMQHYLGRLQRACSGSHIEIMQSSAGTTSVEHAGRYPVHLLLSGPAGGLIAAQAVAGDARLLTFDMGGTSTDVSIIDGAIGFRHGAEVADYPVAVTMVDMHTIGAGGGSIARLDAGGLLLVGPQSAGADPGPACYARGGDAPTVTDANVVLGRLRPEAFLGGGMTLDAAAAEAAVGRLADGLGTGTVAAARGIIDVVNDHMVRALRVMSVQRGEDPRDYTLVSFGGAGGLHVCALAEALGMRRALVPVHAGVLSALGMLAAEQVRERSRSVNTLLQDFTAASVEGVFAGLERRVLAELRAGQDAAAAAPGGVRVLRSVDARYAGQSHTLGLDWEGIDGLEGAFHDLHEATWGHRLDMAVELVNLRVRAVAAQALAAAGDGKRFSLPAWRPGESLQERRVAMPGVDGEVRIVNRAGLEQGQRLRGPVLVTETSATTWVAPAWQCEVDTAGNLVLAREA